MHAWTQLVAALCSRSILVLKPDSINKCDHAFLKVVATLLPQLTKSFIPWKSFGRLMLRIYLLQAVKSLTELKEPGGLHNAAIKVMDVLETRSDLHFLEKEEYDSVADPSPQIISNTSET